MTINGNSQPSCLASTSIASDLPTLRRRIAVARGDEPGDLVLRGGQVVNVFTKTVQQCNVVIADGYISGVGLHDYKAKHEIDVTGKFIIPGLIDAHMHVESTLLTPGELAKIVVPHGTSMLIADPHEIANVMGVRGVELLINASADLPIDIFYMAPSCVPAMNWEHAGAIIEADEIKELLKNPRVLGLAEMMNFPGVINGDESVLNKLNAALAHNCIIDGHAPGLVGQDLVAYAAANIRSDHESTTIDEAIAKAELGLLLQVREGSIARNLDTFLPAMLDDRLGDWCLCTDDIHLDDLIEHGHIDGLLKRVVKYGIAPPLAIRHATLIPARHYGFKDRGAVAPSYRADLAIVNDLESFEVSIVMHKGKEVARNGKYTADAPAYKIPFENTVHLAQLDESSFKLKLQSQTCPVIGIIPDQIVTRHETRDVNVKNGYWCFDKNTDIALLANIERHNATGSIGLGLVEGFNFITDGAIGSSVAHDSHNIIIAGTNPTDMLACAVALEEMAGGFVVAQGGQIIGKVALPVAGLLSTEPAQAVCKQLTEARKAALTLGSKLSCPFGMLSFLALPVIPELKITDQGLFDVVNQRFIKY
ncbi:MAG: adenine deaminase [Planctomycetes bacterium]|nr:adenine deaminase [Planctomycetota bacterium]